MRTLGMIGGTSWHSTIVYYRRINELAAEKLGSQSNPELILHSIAIDIMRRQNKPENSDQSAVCLVLFCFHI